MDSLAPAFALSTFGPIGLMLLALCVASLPATPSHRLWPGFNTLSAGAMAFCVLGALGSALGSGVPSWGQHWLITTPLGTVLALLVQFLGTVIGMFSARYLQGEATQRHYVMALAGVLAAVHLLLMADHWVVLITAWALVGITLQPLLCFYQDRPFALLAGHKKRLADRLADVLLVAAAGLAWWSVGSGSLSELAAHVQRSGMSPALHASAVLLVLAVVLRTALLPVHGWLIQVMEAPTPVSALLHAGVVNLGGFVLIRFAPLLEHATPARWILVAVGLGTAVLAGLVMLTRISIKVRLAWSTVAQMGFMVLECGLGLYTLAALHLVGHSLYKAHAFLSASTRVREARLQTMRGSARPAPLVLWLAPAAAAATVLSLQAVVNPGAWPWWWSLLLGLAWAPILWLPAPAGGRADGLVRGALTGMLMVIGLTLAALLVHALPLGLLDAPDHTMGAVALLGMGALYGCLVLLQTRPEMLEPWRRWSYAGFYVDEYYTRLTLWLWPTRWTPHGLHANPSLPVPLAAANAPK